MWIIISKIFRSTAAEAVLGGAAPQAPRVGGSAPKPPFGVEIRHYATLEANTPVYTLLFEKA